MTSSYEKMSKAIRRQTDMEQKVRLMNAYEIAEEMIKFEDINSELYEALGMVMTLARIKWGNLDPDANEVFEQAKTVRAKARGEDQ